MRFRRVLRWTLGTLTLAGAAGAAIASRLLLADLPPVERLLTYRPAVATRIYAADGSLIGEMFVERRYPVSLAQVPVHVRQAVLACEDAGFYNHPGFQPLSIVRAIRANFSRGHIVQGGSTITQQLVRMLLLSSERTYQRKIRELVLAVQLETRLGKDDILALYLNQIYFGAGAYGIAAAARAIFDVDVGNLTIAQAALLAGLPQSPSQYDPLAHPAEARARQRHVLDRMLREGFITSGQYAAAVHEPLAFAARKSTTYLAAPWYVEHVRRLLEERFGTDAARDGLRVTTAVDLRLQEAAEYVLRQRLRALDERQGFRGPMQHLEEHDIDAFLERAAAQPENDGARPAVVLEARPTGLVVRTGAGPGLLPAEVLVWGGRHVQPSTFHRGDVIATRARSRDRQGALVLELDREPQVEGALLAVDLASARVKAMVGGYDFGRSQFNRAVQAHRQPGSAFKPLLYAAAIDHGYTPRSSMLDAPITIATPQGPWSPRNFKDQYFGRISLRMALARSLNSVSVRLVQSVGIDRVREYLRRFGFQEPLPRNLSLALGTSELTLLELVRAYAVLAAQGRRSSPVFVTGVTDADGHPIPFPGTDPRFERVVEPAVAYMLTDMMETVVSQGTGRRAAELGRPVAGKTGTTNEGRDAWFVGFTPDLISGVWVGFDAERSLGEEETGGHAAAPIWTDFMRYALEDRPPKEFTVPRDVTLVRVDPSSGLRVPDGMPGRLEPFVAGSEPTRWASPPEPHPFDEPEDGLTRTAAPARAP